MTRSRRDFLKASAAVAAGGLVATRSASALSPSGSLIAAPGLISSDLPSADDPAIKALMQAALDVAKTGGASYADVRVAARRQQNVNTRDRIVQGVSDTDTFGLGVRTLVDGAWGFAATSRLDKDSVANATRAALEQARANRASQLRPVFHDMHELRARIELPILGVVSGLISDATRRNQRTDLLRFAAATGVLLGLFILGLISMAVILNRQVA